MIDNGIMSTETECAVKKTPERVVILSGQTPDGDYILSTLFKRTYDIIPGGVCTRALIDAPMNSGDVNYDGPMNSSLKFESDFIPWKNRTDIVFNGAAYAPQQKPLKQLIATLSVGSVTKSIFVTGDRTCTFRLHRDPLFSEPLPFVKMDIRYERAYGGIDIYSNPAMQYGYPRNHLGCGFVVKNNRRSIDELQLPNIEDPENILHPGNICCGDFKRWELQPLSQGFGWYAKFWQPRAALAGVMPADRAVEEKLRNAFELLVPKSQKALFAQTKLPSMDFSFFNGASQGLAVPYLNGDEQVQCVNLSAESVIGFRLPGEKPKLRVDFGFGEQQPETVLHTVLIRMEEKQVDLVWRGAVPYPGPDWLPQMKKKEISLE